MTTEQMTQNQKTLYIVLAALGSACILLLISGAGLLVHEGSETTEVAPPPDQVIGGVKVSGDLLGGGSVTTFTCSYFSGRGFVTVRKSGVQQCPFLTFL